MFGNSEENKLKKSRYKKNYIEIARDYLVSLFFVQTNFLHFFFIFFFVVRFGCSEAKVIQHGHKTRLSHKAASEATSEFAPNPIAEIRFRLQFCDARERCTHETEDVFGTPDNVAILAISLRNYMSAYVRVLTYVCVCVCVYFFLFFFLFLDSIHFFHSCGEWWGQGSVFLSTTVRVRRFLIFLFLFA